MVDRCDKFANPELHITQLQTDLWNLENDITIVCKGDVKIGMNMSLLINRSKYFKSMFESGMKESQTKLVEFKEYNYECVRICLKYIRTAQLTECNDIAMLAEAYELADMWDLENFIGYLRFSIKKLLGTGKMKYIIDVLDYCRNIEDIHKIAQNSMTTALVSRFMNNYPTNSYGSKFRDEYGDDRHYIIDFKDEYSVRFIDMGDTEGQFFEDSNINDSDKIKIFNKLLRCGKIAKELN